MKKTNSPSKTQIETSTRQFENALADSKNPQYILRLYVAGLSPASIKSLENIREICEEHLQGHYELEVIDLYKNPSLAAGEQIIAAPTLIKELPPPLRRIIGDMSNTERVLVGLDLREVTIK